MPSQVLTLLLLVLIADVTPIRVYSGESASVEDDDEGDVPPPPKHHGFHVMKMMTKMAVGESVFEV